MGCAILPQQKNITNGGQISRQHKKTEKIDCRKRSSQALDLVIENVTILEEKLSEADSDFALKQLKQHSLFCTLQSTELTRITNSMQLATTQKDSYVFKEGDAGVCFFLIKQGSVDVQINSKVVKTLQKGDTFGQIALIYCTNRIASIKSKSSNLKLILLKSKLFKQAMRMIREKNYHKTKSLLQNVQIFSLLTTKQKYTMINCLVRQNYKKGTVLFQKNSLAICFYIIQSGKVSLAFDDPTKKDIVLGELQSFGQNAFKQNSKREGTATVVQDLVCLTINQQKMKQCLGGTLSSIVFHNIKKWALKSSPLFSKFDNKQLDNISMQFVTKYSKANQVLMEKQKPADSLIICLQGKINNKPVGSIFNDEYYPAKGNLNQDIIKTDNGVYAKISFQKVKQLLDSLTNQGSVAVAKRRQSVIMKQNQQIIGLQSLDYLTKLGEGQFGLVHLVKDRKSGNLFALKCLEKQKIKQEAMEQSAISERQILASLCHPLIVGYYKAYQDRKNIYFLLQYIYGIQMFEAIRQIGVLNKIMARFYFGSLLLAIQYLHSRNIIYRDVKPQNSIVNYQGKVYLIDMGTAKILKSDNGYRTDTIIGTPHYMAPQVMQGKGYSFQADYWSLGIIFYELICGRLPFAESQENPYKVYTVIMQTPLTFPNFISDEPAKNILKRLINKKIQARAVGGLTGIKSSTYFQGFQWDDLYQGKMVAPYIPRKFRNNTQFKYAEMQGYPLKQFLYDKKRGDKKLTQEFQPWVSNLVM